MHDNRKLRPWELALLLAVCFTLLTGVWAQERQVALAGKLVRLHVVAASDSAEDQAEKLRVRNAVLAVLTPRLEAAADSEDALEIIRAAVPALRKAAKSATAQTVRVEFGTEHYPTRRYDTFSLPAGNYTSLRITLGAGAGHNWWCVVFPPLCVESALTPEAVETLSADDVRLITEETGEYQIRFRILELWDKIAEKLEK